MKTAWKIVILVVLAAIVIGLVLMGVGALTGADSVRIYQAMDEKYQFSYLMEYFDGVAEEYVTAWNSAG